MKEHMIEQIEKVLEEKVRGSLMQHEGGVQIKDFRDGVLRIILTGHCAGCPSAQLTTEELIAKAVKEEIPEVETVVLVHETSQELLDFARKILNHQVKGQD